VIKTFINKILRDATKTGLLLLVMIILCGGITSAQTHQKKAEVKETVNTQEVRIPTDERLREISINPDYSYNEAVSEPTLWDRFRMWLNGWLSKILGTDAVDIILKTLAAIGFILVLLLLINQISRGELKNAIARRKNRTLLDLRREGTIVSDDKLDELLNDAIRQKKFAAAVRYLYQKSLFILRQGELIKWKADKTNHDYLDELGNHPAAHYFDRLTYFYEYVDYGDFNIDEPRFQVIQNVYDDFRSSLEDNT
jgi:Na+-translocating ferredoxin:NAD+ oxidoreductase RnfG subunit